MACHLFGDALYICKWFNTETTFENIFTEPSYRAHLKNSLAAFPTKKRVQNISKGDGKGAFRGSKSSIHQDATQFTFDSFAHSGTPKA